MIQPTQVVQLPSPTHLLARDTVTPISTPTLAVTETPSPTATASTTEKMPISVKKTKDLNFTLTPTISLFKSSYKTLIPGEYLIYHTHGKYRAVSIDGKYDEIFFEGFEPLEILQGSQRVYGVDLETGKYYFVNMVTGIAEPVVPPEAKDCRSIPDPIKGERLLLWCRYDYQIYVIDEKGEKIQISNPQKKDDYFINPQWSPDGKWISFFGLINLAEQKFKNELFLAPTTCLLERDSCKQVQKGPYQHSLLSQSFYAWSPDSTKIAILSSDTYSPIQVLDMDKESFKPINVSENKGGISSLAWSPDSMYLAYTNSLIEDPITYRIFFIEVNSGKTKLMENGPADATIKFWITVP